MCHPVMFKHFIFKTILPVLDYQCELFVLFDAIIFFETVLYLDSFLASVGNGCFPLYRIHFDNIWATFWLAGRQGQSVLCSNRIFLKRKQK